MIPDYNSLPDDIHASIILKLENKECRVWQVVVLDQWKDDNLQCILVRAFDIRFQIDYISLEEASAFRFVDSPTARNIIRRVLINKKVK